MGKLTACGHPFGEGGVEVPPGSYDWLWNKVKAEMIKDGVIKNIQKAVIRGNLTKYMTKLVLVDIFQDGWTELLSQKERERYIEELVDLIHEKSN